jgi:undecaprenyl-diphosphatase
MIFHLNLMLPNKKSFVWVLFRKMNKKYQPENTSNKNWVLFLFIILLSSGIFSWLAIHVKSGKTFLIDKEAFAITIALRNNFMNLLMEFMTFLGSSTFLLPANIIIALFILFYKKNYLFSIYWAVTATFSLLLMYFFKGIYQRPRPLDPFLESATGFSFPSGHTLNSLVFFGLIIFSLWKYGRNKSLRIWGTILLILIILAIGLSRIYLRVHYASDVLGGLSLGICWLTISIYLLGLIETRNRNSI